MAIKVLTITSSLLFSAWVAPLVTIWDKSEKRLDLAATSSQSAAVLSADSNLDVYDHYGNPDRFMRYIIRIPPVHA